MWVKSTRGGTVNQVMPVEVRDRMRGTPEFAARAAKYCSKVGVYNPAAAVSPSGRHVQARGWRYRSACHDTGGGGGGRIDLDAYLERIGYAGGRSVSVDTLAEIHLHHPRTIPFENPIHFCDGRFASMRRRSSRNSCMTDAAGTATSTTCCSVTSCVNWDSRCRGLAARVLWNVPEGTVRPRSHMLLLIGLDRPSTMSRMLALAA